MLSSISARCPANLNPLRSSCLCPKPTWHSAAQRKGCESRAKSHDLPRTVALLSAAINFTTVTRLSPRGLPRRCIGLEDAPSRSFRSSLSGLPPFSIIDDTRFPAPEQFTQTRNDLPTVGLRQPMRLSTAVRGTVVCAPLRRNVRSTPSSGQRLAVHKTRTPIDGFSASPGDPASDCQHTGNELGGPQAGWKRSQRSRRRTWAGNP